MDYPPDYDGGNDNGDDYESWRKALNICVASLSSIMCLVGIFFMVAIVKTRKFTFNLYIIFCILPDSLCNGILGISLFCEALNDGAMPAFLCSWMCFHLLFYYLSNLYVNAVIAKEVHTLVVNSYQRKRTTPPAVSKVICQVGIVYATAGLVSGWFTAPLSWSIMEIDSDPICVSRFQNIYGGLAINVILSLPPFLYVFWVAYQIRKERLLPRKGRTRVLALYFMRIIVIFVAFYCPILILATYGFVVAPGPEDPVSTVYFLSLQILKILFPIQNIVTFRFLLQKEDIKEAIQDSTCCCKHSSLLKSFRGSNAVTETGETVSEWFLDDVYETQNSRTETNCSLKEDETTNNNDEEAALPKEEETRTDHPEPPEATDESNSSFTIKR